ncbi:MAG TPA: PAS domain-containing sensor histidine kinase [Roseiflexaceae bacterium]|nr:PAS domain-containing sensor histidine kinase [Roseiflexaceae bacterium]
MPRRTQGHAISLLASSGAAPSDARLAEAQALSARLAALNETTALLIASKTQDELLRTLAQQARWVLDFQHCTLALCDGDGYRQRDLHALGPGPWSERRAFDSGAVGRALAQGQAQVLAELSPEDGAPADMCSALALPLRQGSDLLGMLTFYSRHTDHYTLDDLRIAYALSMQITALIDRDRLFETVRQTRDKLETVLESSQDGILVTDTSGRTLLLNSALRALFGLPEGDLEGLSARELLRLAAPMIGDQAAVQALARSGGMPEPKPVPLRLVDGRTLEWSRVPLHGNGMLEGYVFSVRDITDRVELERLREDMVHMLVHDLRTPLTSMRLGLDLIGMVAGDNPEVRELLGTTRQSTRQLLDQVNTILDVSKLEAGRLELDLVPSDLGLLIPETLQRLTPLTVQNQQQLGYDLPEALPTIQADAPLLRRVIENLVGNALKFTPHGGTVTIGVGQSSPDALELWVRDNGPGIPVDQHARIFEKYGQVRGSDRRSGTGLGLTFCKLVVEAHGGLIGVREAPGGGSVFWLTLPVQQAAQERSVG